MRRVRNLAKTTETVRVESAIAGAGRFQKVKVTGSEEISN